LVYKSKSSILLFSVVLLTVAAQLQWGGARWEELSFALRVESRADLDSLNDDAQAVGREIKSFPNGLKMLWFDFRSNLLAIQADAAVETELAAERISPLVENR
jgi:hypothetical protein